MARAIGLEIGPQSLKLALLEGSGARARLVDFVIRKIESDEEETDDVDLDQQVRTAIEEMFAQNKLPTTNVVTALNASDVVLRDIQVPFTRDDQIRSTIKFQAESHLHSVAIENMIVDYYKVGEAGEKSKLIVAAAKKDTIRSHLEMLNACAIEPLSIDLDLAAIFNAYKASGVLDEVESALIVDIGADTLRLVVTFEGRIVAVRSLRMRIGSLQPAAHTLASDDEFAYRALESGQMSESGSMDSSSLPFVILDEDGEEFFNYDMSAPGMRDDVRISFLNKVCREIDRTVTLARLRKPVERIVLTGGDTAMPDMDRFFSERYEIEVEKTSLASYFRAKGKLASQQELIDTVGAAAIGLALKGLGSDASGFDFRREEFVNQTRFDRLKRGLAATSVLLFVVFFLLAYICKQEVRDYRTASNRLLRTQKDMFYRVMGREPERSSGILTEMKRAQRDIEKLLGTGRNYDPFCSSLDCLRDFAKARAQVKLDFKLTSIKSYKNGSFIVEAEIPNDPRQIQSLHRMLDQIAEDKDSLLMWDPNGHLDQNQSRKDQGVLECSIKLKMKAIVEAKERRGR